MFKASLLTIALLASGSAVAQNTATATATAQSKLMYRGATLSDAATVGLDLRFNDLFVDGAFVRAKFDTTSGLAPFNRLGSIRTDLGVGFAGQATLGKWEVSLNRVLNPVIYSADYTELRGRVSHGALFAEVGQGLTGGVNKDTYLATGIQQKVGPVLVGGLVSTIRYNTPGANLRDGFNFNNAEVFAKYNVWKNVDLNVNYSYGGRDRFGSDIKNQVWGGVTARF
jgi:hypothetical protein